MAKNISLILQRFKDVGKSILTLIFEDSPAFQNNGAEMYLGSRELLELLEKLGKTGRPSRRPRKPTSSLGKLGPNRSSRPYPTVKGR
jgi:hypothetical protein